ncbi:type II toxin-antitoxin system HicA family toxin [Adlercreutzia sp. ZJ138]|uniref:type II toxin-antitoxin system HicA family toxin n=1 Tax=Adlercreutzia sp. ZJ138 TaxID=2709405 RepID=UPI0013EBF47B|nr:type II toxin-antitoxin system HicA family toxin [Adlercreutzia sp. ZJ138]
MVKRRQVELFFKEHGFINEGGTNHDKLVHPDGRWTTLGRHKEISNKLFDEMKK